MTKPDTWTSAGDAAKPALDTACPKTARAPKSSSSATSKADDSNEAGIPAFLKMAPDERRQGWQRNPPKPPASTPESGKNDDAATAAVRAEVAAAKKAKTEKRIEKLKQTKAATQADRPAEPTGETDMRKTTPARKATKGAKTTARRDVSPKKSTAKAAKKAADGNGASGPRPGTKTALVADLLRRKNGCTMKEVLAATGWPAVSMPQQAKAAGIALRKEKKDGEPTRYYAAA